MSAQTFYVWLMGQSDRDCPIGDFSNDVKRDENAPKTSNSKDVWSLHLATTGASEALEAAWCEYEDA